MKTFKKLLFVWLLIATLINLAVLCLPYTSEKDKHLAIMLTIVNMATLYAAYDYKWRKNKK